MIEAVAICSCGHAAWRHRYDPNGSEGRTSPCLSECPCTEYRGVDGTRLVGAESIAEIGTDPPTEVRSAPGDAIDHPAHYGGADDPYEPIKIIEAKQLGFHDGNALKYILRAGYKPGESRAKDLRKAAWYLTRLADQLEDA